MKFFNARWRVRRRRRVEYCEAPYAVEYRLWYWPFWICSTGFVMKDTAVKYAKERILDEVIKIT